HPSDAGSALVSYAADAAPAIDRSGSAGPRSAPEGERGATIDAAPAIDVAEVRKLFDSKDYNGVLLLAGSNHADPQGAQIGADAKQHYVDAQRKEIADHVAHGECDQAKADASDGTKLVPEAGSAFAKAATCAAKAKPPTTQTGSAAPVNTATAEQAVDQYAKG